MALLPAVEIEPPVPATAAVIWLHGLGADGHDFEPVVPELGLPADAPIRFVFPHAPRIPVTINNGYVMPAWYDILEMDLGRRVDTGQLLASARAVQALVDRERERGIASERIVLAGFSQGGAVVYQAALTYPEPLAGVLALSTYFATADTIRPDAANRKLLIRICHGLMDDVVPESLGQAAQKRLQEMGYAPEYLTYPIGHSVSLAEIRDLGMFLRAWLLP
ncbi:MAG: carboxylesterase [Thiothrix sp.]|nr:carboxylesterase [Thiothrix sp.]HPQ96408.1 carboxylesterase [Thiolinea sp.]